MSITSNKNLDQLTALFLAEILRSRRTSLRRAGEISRRIISIISSATTEAEALSKLVEIEKDFEEVSALKQVLNFNREASGIEVFEKEIKEYASQIFSKDMVLSANFLAEASNSKMTIRELCVKYPDFSTFLVSCTPGATSITGVQPA